MAGETQKTAAVCLRIHPWSRTSHIVSWLTPDGPLSTIVKGAVRPKSAFLGQYDLNYTCEILYYVRGRRGLHPLRECAPLNLRENLRGDFRNLALAGYFRELMVQFAPVGAEAQQWYGTLEDALENLTHASGAAASTRLGFLLDFEIKVLCLAGLDPRLEARQGLFVLRGARQIPVSAPVAHCLHNPRAEKDLSTLRDTARALGVFYMFHLDTKPENRRNVLKLIST